MNVAESITHRVAIEYMKDGMREVDHEHLVRTARVVHGGRRWGCVTSAIRKSLIAITQGLQSSPCA